MSVIHLENCARGGDHGNLDIKGGQLKLALSVNTTSYINPKGGGHKISKGGNHPLLPP